MISSNNRSKDGKNLFLEVIGPLPQETQKALSDVFFNPRFKIDWDSIYYELSYALPKYNGDTVTLAVVERALDRVVGWVGIVNELSESGYGPNSLLTYDDIVDILYEYFDRYDRYNEFNHSDMAEEVAREAFRLKK